MSRIQKTRQLQRIQVQTPKRVLITGGVRRMGLAIAHAFSERGAMLGLNYYHASKKEAEAAQEDCLRRGARQVLLIKGDITREATSVLGHFVKQAKGIDVLVNNAGVLPPQRTLEELSLKELQHTLDLNLLAPFVLAQAAAKEMEAGSAIINIASLGAFEIWKSRIDYHVSKAGLVTLTKALARELGPRKISVNAIAPGAISADEEQAKRIGTLEEKIPFGKYGVPDDIAKVAIFFAYDSSYLTGQTIIVDGGRSVYR
jgi:NAD(P)-dependent dehydrogenase (short-subunit alcohol dehydrogenase family)